MYYPFSEDIQVDNVLVEGGAILLNFVDLKNPFNEVYIQVGEVLVAGGANLDAVNKEPNMLISFSQKKNLLSL